MYSRIHKELNFDYISTVIPVINPSNSKDKLKEELRIRGYEDIPDDDLEEIAFLLTICVCYAILQMNTSNIVNDFVLPENIVESDKTFSNDCL